MKKPDILKEDLVQKIVAAIKTISGIDIPPEKYGENLFLLGLDSLKAIQVVNQLEDDLDIMIDDVHLQKFTSIDAITAFFANFNG